jgi:hypothetical protein
MQRFSHKSDLELHKNMDIQFLFILNVFRYNPLQISPL